MNMCSKDFRDIKFWLNMTWILSCIQTGMIAFIFCHGRSMRDLLEERIEATEDVVIELIDTDCDGTCVPRLP